MYLTQRRGDARGKPGEFADAPAVPQDGTYRVRLHFARIYRGATGGSQGGPGRRVFNVDAEGVAELIDDELYADVGPMAAAVKQFEVDVEDGARDQPMVAAIEVVGAGTGER